MPNLTTFEWLLICSTVAGPVLAVQAQKFVERAREKRGRKLHIFYTLMATRAARLAPDHVQALNMIDIEFYGRRLFGVRFQRKKEKQVVESWRIYQDHLNQLEPQPRPEALRAWTERGDQLFTDLLVNMSVALGYDFDPVRLRRGVYTPRAHVEQQIADLQVRDGLRSVLSGERPLHMAVTALPTTEEATERWKNAQEAIIAALSGEHPVKVKIEPEGRPAE